MSAKVRIGERMYRAIDYVAGHADASKHEVSKAIGPHGSSRYGSEIVLRCIRHGLIVDANRNDASKWVYALHVTDAGRKALAEGR